MSDNDNWLNQQNDKRTDYQNGNKFVRKRDVYQVVCSKYVKIWAILAVFVVTIPALVYYLAIDNGSFPLPPMDTCMVHKMFRVPCGKANLTRDECWRLSCCFDPKEKDCYHSIPSRYNYVKSKSPNIYETRIEKSPLGTKTVKKVSFIVTEKDENVVNIKLGVFNDNNSVLVGDYATVNKSYDVRMDHNELGVEIFRKGSGELLLSTYKGPLIVSDKYLEWTLFPGMGLLFGVNRNLIEVPRGKTFKQVFYKNKLDHYSIPTLWLFSRGKTHGISIIHEGPLEIIIKESNVVIMRSLTLDDIEIEVFVGDTPKKLHYQRATIEKWMPFWTMETHLCRYIRHFKFVNCLETRISFKLF